ncbi:MAG: type III glutamate--ammonia ligase [Solirubrobacterales bacterium]|nr:type III glutamate--ammonia ligase [Solirubrobacterales bacterium]
MAIVSQSPPSYNEAELEAARRRLEEVGVKYAMATYADGHGTAKCKSVPLAHFEQMMRGSELFTGAALDLLGQSPADDELAVHPDLDAIVQLPWRPTIAFAPGNLYLRGEPYSMCSRTVLTRQVARARERGFIFNLGMETEFYFVTVDEHGRPAPWNPRDVLDKPCYDAIGMLESLDFLDEMVGHLNAMGWDVHSFDHEDGNGQYEFDFSYTDAIAMGDRFMLFRMMAKEIARSHGYEATFMPKPWSDKTGGGAHFNMSLASADNGANLFEPEGEDLYGCGISTLGYQFLAGILRHAPAIVAVSAPTVNSYKRLIKRGSMSGSTWAPVFISYGRNNRTHMLRVPTKSPRVESRAVDASVNAYLGAAMVLAAGLEAIDEGADPGPPIDLDMYVQPDDKLRALGVQQLPRTLQEAIDAFEASDLARGVFGEDLHRAYVDFKRAEWEDFHNTVSDWEWNRYLTFY